MDSGFATSNRRSLRAVLAVGMVLLAVATTSVNGAAAAPVAPVKVERVAAAPKPQGVEPIPNGMLPATNYPVPAGAIHVAIDGDDGTGDGTSAKPFQSLRKAVAVAWGRPAPRTVVMHAGDYPEGAQPGPWDVPISKPIGIDRPMTIQAAPGEKVWLKGSDVHTNWQKLPNVDKWKAVGWTSPFCQDCYDPMAIDPAYPMAGKPEQVFFNGLPLRQVGSLGAVGNGTFFYNAGTRELTVGNNPAGVVVEISNRWNALYLNAGASGTIIRGIGFANYAPTLSEANVNLGAVVTGASNLTFENNAFVRNSATGLGGSGSDRMVVRGNVLSYNGARGMNLNLSHQATVTLNRFEQNNTERFRVNGCDHACTVAGFKAARADDLSVVNNTFLNNYGAGFWCDLGCTDTLIQNNSIQGNRGSGIVYETGARTNITGNWVVGTPSDGGQTSAGIVVSGSEDVTINSNVIVGNIRQIGMYDTTRTPAAENETYSMNLGLTWDTVRARITNNTFVWEPLTGMLLKTLATPQVAAPGMFSQLSGNTVRNASTQVFHWERSTTDKQDYTGLTAFEAGTGWDFGSAG